jgi:hypothetical protein
MIQNTCDKTILADNCGVRLIYCKNCNVVELEIGAISVRLSPDIIQHVANIMMKASLKLDRTVAEDKMLTNHLSQVDMKRYFIH